MQNLIGQSIGRYHIIEQLGEGGMAFVYKAYDTRLEREVAVKMIRTDQLVPAILERAIKRFEREAKAVSKLNHPNIVKVIDYGDYEGQPFLVMEYMPGGTLKQLLKAKGRLPWQEAARMTIKIAGALEYAHNHKVIHRDIKPSNILLTSENEPILTDFGVAKVLDEETTQDLTGTSASVGTPEYMAPEQVTSKMVDHRVDIYAMGIVFYEMVTGRKPYNADTPLAVLFKHISDPLPSPSIFTEQLPDAVEKILFTALAKNPDYRYQDMQAFILSLQSTLTINEDNLIDSGYLEKKKKPSYLSKNCSKKRRNTKFGLKFIEKKYGRIVIMLFGIMLISFIFMFSLNQVGFFLQLNNNDKKSYTQSMTDEETVINEKTAIVTNPISSVTKIYKTLDSLPRVTPELSATLIPSTTEVLATPTKEIITSSMSNPAFVINDLHISVKGDYVKSIWFLQDIPEKMVFNRSGVEANEAEYIWEILIDTDNNPLTGFSDEDLSGVDYAIGIYNFGSRSEEKQLPLNEGVQASVFMAEGYSYTYVSDADLIVDPIENTITLSGYVPGITTNSIFYYEIFDHNSLEEPEHRFLDNVEFLE